MKRLPHNVSHNLDERGREQEVDANFVEVVHVVNCSFPASRHFSSQQSNDLLHVLEESPATSTRFALSYRAGQRAVDRFL